MPDFSREPKGTGFFMAYEFRGARNPPAEPTTSFQGKTVLITGANVGLGLEAATWFAKLGAAHLILGVRNLAKGEAAKTEILARSAIQDSAISVLQIDYASFASVSNFAEAVTANTPRLDVAVLNAGLAMPVYEKGTEGWETTLQVNVLSTALLAVELLPLLRATATMTGTPSHLEMVGSNGYIGVKPEVVQVIGPADGILEHFNEEVGFDAERQYRVSKMLLMFVQQGLVQSFGSGSGIRAREDPIVVTSCPNLCKTTISRGFPFLVRTVLNILYYFMRTAEQGSRILVGAAATGPEAHGRMWMNDTFDDASPLIPQAKWEELQPRAWQEILDVLKKHKPDLAI